MTSEAPVLQVGSYKYTYKPDSGVPGVGAVTCTMYGYVDDSSDQPTWYHRWTCTDPQHVQYILDKHPTLEQDGEVVIY